VEITDVVVFGAESKQAMKEHPGEGRADRVGGELMADNGPAFSKSARTTSTRS
jgi:hypothetical protein